MKLLTLNTHSLLEENYQQKLEQFVITVLKEKPDLIALQEVNQRMNSPLAELELLTDWIPCPGDKLSIRQDNHVAQVALRLRHAGFPCSWTWTSAKIGYDIYEEGMALLCTNQEIESVESFFISDSHSYKNWKTRKTLGIKLKGYNEWFYTVHMGWWQDEEEPFLAQWERLNTALQQKKKESTVWLLGDFNSPAEFSEQGYDCIQNSGWLDTFRLAEQKDNGITVEGTIDGWHSVPAPKGMRMDYIWCSKSVPVQSSKVLFNGTNEPKVSDHFGVLIETINP